MDALKTFSSAYLFSGSRAIWEQHVRIFRLVPVCYSLQFFITTPAGKTTLPKNILNIPGKFGWITQELVAPIVLIATLYYNKTHSWQTFINLPLPNIILSSLYVVHYIHRALISPLRAPNLSPMHIGIWFMAIAWNYMNAYSLAGSLLLRFDNVNTSTSVDRLRFIAGLGIWLLGFVGNIWHEGVLYEIRRRANKERKGERNDQNKRVEEKRKGGQEQVETEVVDGKERLRIRHMATGQVYEIPEGGLYEYCWHPHYFCEWVEWTGFLIAAGPFQNRAAQNFLLNELSTMIPRTLQGRRWYQQKFGDRTPKRKAAIPFLI